MMKAQFPERLTFPSIIMVIQKMLQQIWLSSKMFLFFPKHFVLVIASKVVKIQADNEMGFCLSPVLHHM